MPEETGRTDHLDLTAKIVSAYLIRNALPRAELTALIGVVHEAVIRLAAGRPQTPAAAVAPASVKRSVTPDFILCLEDGKKFKSLKRHLRTAFGMTPEQYRAKWGLPQDYPMVAPNYARARSNLAREMGLGQRGKQAAAKAATTSIKVAAPHKGRRKKRSG
jgi:predicted transcriptional regulator